MKFKGCNFVKHFRCISRVKHINKKIDITMLNKIKKIEINSWTVLVLCLAPKASRRLARPFKVRDPAKRNSPLWLCLRGVWSLATQRHGWVESNAGSQYPHPPP